MSENEKLIPVEGETVIATITGRYNGVEEKRTVYYGNIVTTEGKKGKFKVKAGQYEKLLKEFFESEEGKNYINPEDERKEATEAKEKKKEAEKTAAKPAKPSPDSSKQDHENQEKAQDKPVMTETPIASPDKTPDDVALTGRTTDTNALTHESEAGDPVMTDENPEIKEGEVVLAEMEASVDDVVLTETPEVDDIHDNNPDEPVMTETPERSGRKPSVWQLVTAIAAILAGVFSGITAFNSLDFNKQEEVEPVKEYEVVKVTESIPAGTVITDEMLTAETLPEPDYLALFTDKQIIRTDGSTVYEKPVLWSNKSQAVGTYAVDTINPGTYLLNSSYSTLKEGDALVEMNIDGTTVRVPVTTVANGSSTIRLYAIVTSSDSSGNKKTYPMDLGEFKLEGKELKDILNSEGKSILEQITKDNE